MTAGGDAPSGNGTVDAAGGAGATDRAGAIGTAGVAGGAGAGFALPAGWILADERPRGVDAVAIEPRDPDDPVRFRSNLVLTTSTTGGLSFSDWQNGTDELLPRMLDGYLLVDLERLEFHGRPAGRRLAHHTGPGGRPLTMEQWFTQIDDVGYTLTATVETARYDALADTLAAAAASWSPGP